MALLDPDGTQNNQNNAAPTSPNCLICGKANPEPVQNASVAQKPLTCDECPSTFHPACMGYMTVKQYPRGKWKCYFCKVSSHGIGYNGRMSPKETQLFKPVLETHDSWNKKAKKLIAALKNWDAFHDFLTIQPKTQFLNQAQNQKLIE